MINTYRGCEPDPDYIKRLPNRSLLNFCGQSYFGSSGVAYIDAVKSKALAIQGNRMVFSYGQSTKGNAKKKALDECRFHLGENCAIVDVDGVNCGLAERREQAAEEEKKRKEEAKRKAAEEEKKRKEEAKRKAAEEEKKRKEEKKRAAEAADKKAYFLNNLQQVGLGELETFILDYQSVLDTNSRNILTNVYFERSRDKAVNEHGNVLKAIAETFTMANSKRLDLSQIDDAGVQVFDISNERENDEIEFPVILLKQNLPSYLRPEKTTFREAVDSMKAGGADYLVMISVANATSNREISGHETVQSEYLFREDLVPNPDYRRAQMDYMDTKEMFDWYNLQQAECVAARCTLIFGGDCCLNCRKMCNLYKKWKPRYAAARKHFLSLEEYTTRPVYQPYEFRKSKISIQKNVLLNIYFLDKKNAKFFVVPVNKLGKKMEYTLVHGLNEKDRSHSHEKSSAASDESIARDEEAPQKVDLSEVLNTLSVRLKNAEPLPSLDDLKEHIFVTSTEIAEKEEEAYVVTAETGGNKRFESVVVIFHPAGGIGSGFYVTEDTVLTNYHVTEGTSFLELALFNGDETFGKVIAKDLRLDLALIKVQARGEPVTIYREKSLTLGSTVEAIGHPSGLEFSITRGSISGIRRLPSRYDPGGKSIRFIQTDVAINPGNSGGPLYLGQKVVGVNTLKLVSEEIEGLNFAVHYNELIRFLAKNGIE
jgi:serine protease Do